MDAIEQLQTKISPFSGYGDETARALSDELVRSYLGEALAALEERLAPGEGPEHDRIGELILRVAFTNQLVFRQYEERARTGDVGHELAPYDVAIVELADGANAIEPANLDDYLSRVRDALDRRDAAMGGRLGVS